MDQRLNGLVENAEDAAVQNRNPFQYVAAQFFPRSTFGAVTTAVGGPVGRWVGKGIGAIALREGAPLFTEADVLAGAQAGQRARLIDEARARSAELRAKFGGLTSEDRMARIDQLSQANWGRRLDEMVNSQQYVFRYLTESGYQASMKYGTVRGYATTTFSSSSADVMQGAQVLEQWAGAPYTGPVKYGVAIPVDKLNGFSVARPYGNAGTTGWEVFANSYPQAGAGGWSQFLLNPVSVDDVFMFTLRP
jgi:hypothetical protein